MNLIQAYALALVCGIFPLEAMHRLFQRGPVMTRVDSNANSWAGRTVLASGSATVVVSTFQVTSDALIFLTAQNHANVASGTYKAIEVRSISPGNHFTLGTADGIANARDTTLMWEIKKTS